MLLVYIYNIHIYIYIYLSIILAGNERQASPSTLKASAFPLPFLPPKQKRAIDCHLWWLGLLFLHPVFSRFLWLISFFFFFFSFFFFFFCSWSLSSKRSMLSFWSELSDRSSRISSSASSKLFLFLGLSLEPRAGSVDGARPGLSPQSLSSPPGFETLNPIHGKTCSQKTAGSQFHCWKCCPKLAAKVELTFSGSVKYFQPAAPLKPFDFEVSTPKSPVTLSVKACTKADSIASWLGRSLPSWAQQKKWCAMNFDCAKFLTVRVSTMYCCC